MKFNAVQLFGFPTLCVALGRRGSGKSNTGRVAAKYWRAPAGAADKVLLIDRLTVDMNGTHRADTLMREPPQLDAIKGKFSLVIVDEADQWLPLNGKPDPALIDMIRRGRHYGLTMLLMTQRPASLSYDARALADKLFIFSLTSEADLRWCEGLDSDLKAHRDFLQRARPGECLLWDGKDYNTRLKRVNMPLDKT